MDDLDRLKELAERATKGPWTGAPRKGYYKIWLKGHEELAVCRSHGDSLADLHNSQYIAAANPQAILSLIATLEAERVRREKAERERDEARSDHAALCRALVGDTGLSAMEQAHKARAALKENTDEETQ